MTSQHAPMNAARRMIRSAFTLIEMLTVIGILAILISIIIPAINGARNAARKTDTRTQMVGVTQAAAAFQIDNRRLPGYFSPRQMGANANTMAGFTTMDNMLLDLLGGITTQARDGIDIFDFGCDNTPAGLVRINKSAMGATKQSTSGAISKSYISFDQKRYVAQTDTGARVSGPVADNLKFPSLVDSFGQPILAWIGDDVPSAGTFAALNVSTAGANGARFYQAQNAGFLDATSLGKLKQDQSSAVEGSVITGTNANLARSMEALLGNASQPDPAAPAATPKPLAARAPLVLHSAGLDGVYVGRRDKGARQGFVAYQPNADAFGGALFDDIIVTGGN